MKNEIIAAVKSFVSAKVVYNETVKIEDNTELWKTGLIDSMGVIRLISHMQEVFEIEEFDYNDITLDNFNTPNSIADLVLKYKTQIKQ
ncbi:MAG: hypothetical protein GQ574_00110 [Crocinitomix sp.]|nr:hypothetical protein [Crocinitomix sp.]